MNYDDMTIEALEALKAKKRLAEKAIRQERAEIQAVIDKKLNLQSVQIKIGNLSDEERALLAQELAKHQVVQLGVAEAFPKSKQVEPKEGE